MSRFAPGAALSMQAYQLMRVGSAIGVSVLLAKSGLSAGDIGRYEALLYVGSTLSVFVVNGLLQAISPLYARLDEAERPAFLFQVFALFCAFAAALYGVWMVGERWITPALTGVERLPYFRLYGLYLLLHLPVYPIEYVFLLRQRHGALLLWGATGFGLYAIAVFVPAYAGYGLAGSIGALVALGALRLVWAAWVVLRDARPHLPPFDHWAAYLRFAYPLSLNMLAGSAVLLFDLWLVAQHYRDERIFAVYRYGARELPLALALATALGAALIPLLSERLDEGMAELKRRGRRLMLVAFAFAMFLMPWTDTLFRAVFNPEFEESAPVFRICLLLTASRVLLPNAVVLAIGRPRWIFGVGLLELGVKVALGLVLIRIAGLQGVAWSMVVAFFVEKAGLIWLLEKRARVRTGDWLDIRLYLLLSLALLGAYVFTQG
ncbi:MAG: lipopolysaccharide biosynthesis protein [Saprospiraceae bacterium]